jgi:LmbE family N-acetylglucosaminyl deacetylase
MLIVSDGRGGSGQHGHLPRPDVTMQGDALVDERVGEANAAAEMLGTHAPIFLGFPDGKLGDYLGDRTLIYRLTARLAEELRRLRPDVVITWGPDGGTGHPDHRIVSSVVTQLQRTGAPGVPERLFYMTLPLEAIRAFNPARAERPLVLPLAKYATTRVSFAAEDLAAAKRAMACHRTQYTTEVVARVTTAAEAAWAGAVRLVPAFATAGPDDVFG